MNSFKDDRYTDQLKSNIFFPFLHFPQIWDGTKLIFLKQNIGVGVKETDVPLWWVAVKTLGPILMVIGAPAKLSLLLHAPVIAKQKEDVLLFHILHSLLIINALLKQM
jgi:hypothetical protein